MLRRAAWFLLALPIAAVLVTLAVANRHGVRLILDPFDELCDLQKRWRELMDYAGEGEANSRIRQIIEGERT